MQSQDISHATTDLGNLSESVQRLSVGSRSVYELIQSAEVKPQLGQLRRLSKVRQDWVPNLGVRS